MAVLYDQRGFDQEEFILELQSVKSREQEHRINIPLQLKYMFPFPTFRPFLSGGISYHYLLKAKGDLEHFTLASSPVIGIRYSEDGYDLTALHKRSTLNWLVSAGMQVKVKGGFSMEVKLCYERGLNNLINEKNRHSDPILLKHFAYVPDDVKVSSWMVGFSFFKNISKPRKK